MNRFYMLVCTVAAPVIHLLFPVSVSGLENLNREQSVVFCANHASAWDPILLCLALPRRMPIRIMAKKELMEKPVIGWFLKKLGVFGVDRGHSDLNAVKTAIQTVRNGGNLLVFPEGTRVERAGQVRAKGGVVMIAMRTGAVLLPVFVGGKKRLFHRTHIVFGQPYHPATATRHGTAEEYQAFADEVLRRAYALSAQEK